MARFVAWRNRHGVLIEYLIVDSRYGVLVKLVSTESPHGLLRLLEGGLLVSVQKYVFQAFLVVHLALHQIFGGLALLLHKLTSFWFLFYKRLLLL